MEHAIEQMAEFATGLRFSDLPAGVRVRAQDQLIDSIACMCGGFASQAAKVGRRLAPAVLPGTSDAARWVGAPERSTTVDAAGFVNTAMVRYLDYNDTYPGGHPSDSLGPVLAMVDARDASGRDALTALVVAYEVFNRIAHTAQLRERGWDQGFGVAMATTASLCNLLGLDAETAAHALSIASVSSISTRATRAGELSQWKGTATAFAARNATFSTQLAQHGITGPADPISGRHGFKEQVSADFDLAPFGTSTEDFLTPATKIKYWPVEYNLQAVVWAALGLREAAPSHDVASVEIETYWSAWHETANDPTKWDPRTRETADHSMPFVFARALLGGGISVTDFEPAVVTDPGIRPTMAKVSVSVADDIEGRFPAETMLRATLTTTTGARHRVEIVHPLGDPRNPVSPEQLAVKFLSMAGRPGDSTDATEALDLLGRTAELRSLRPVLDALARSRAMSADAPLTSSVPSHS